MVSYNEYISLNVTSADGDEVKKYRSLRRVSYTVASVSVSVSNTCVLVVESIVAVSAYLNLYFDNNIVLYDTLFLA